MQPDRDQRIEDVLLTVWAAALDAKAMMAEPDATEDHYLRKQRHHIDQAKATILELIEGAG